MNKYKNRIAYILENKNERKIKPKHLKLSGLNTEINPELVLAQDYFAKNSSKTLEEDIQKLEAKLKTTYTEILKLKKVDIDIKNIENSFFKRA